MDTTETILLTALINIIITGLISGVAVYRIQRKIDAAFQQSLFEYQTKFVQIHAKRVETLENLYKKFLLYIKTFQFDMSPEINAGLNDSSIDFSKYEEAKSYSDDAGKYFLNNRLFLPSDIVVEIEKIFHRQTFFDFLIDWIAKNKNSPSFDDLQFAKYLIKELDLETDIDIGSGLGTDALTLLLMLFIKRTGQDAETLEKLYKSVADLKE